MQRKVILAVKLFLLIFCGIGGYLLISNLMLKESLKKITKAVTIVKNKDPQKHKKLEEDIRRKMEEKYRADMISYKVVMKRLKQEQDRQKNSSGKVNTLNKKDKAGAVKKEAIDGPR
ncbi:MAG: hypothetical protein PHC37_06980 [Candidatus Omnitrophica bacterium]|nr:hypothetical protein [Candidatus Omnitrophota bacterium]MDD5691417.1 hypothetical protein [Candidatus Omnitrophota bacterium]